MTNPDKIFQDYLKKRPQEEMLHAVRTTSKTAGEKQSEEIVEALLRWCGTRAWINGVTVESLRFLSKGNDYGRKFTVGIEAKVKQEPLTIKQIAHVFLDVAEQVTKKNDELIVEIESLNAHIEKFYDFCEKTTGHEYKKSETPEYLWDEEDYDYSWRDVYICSICEHRKVGEIHKR